MKKLALLSFIFLLPLYAHAGSLININTADATLLETLSGIGPSKANAIIEYRTQHGPFAAISDIQNVSGIGPSTFANIESSIAIDGTNPASAPSQAASSSSSSSTVKTSTTAAPANEPAVVVDGGGDRTVIAGAETTYTANVSDKSGTPYPTPEVHWSFGDGSSAIGASVFKSYKLPGTYLVSVSAIAGMGTGSGEFQVLVRDAQVSITKVSPDGITITNADAADTLDLSHWQLSSGATLFTIPQGTKIVAGGSVTFTPDITGLVGAATATLLYPSGKPVAQLSPVQASSHQVQTVASAAITSPQAPAHATTAVSAPVASTQVAAAGAALPAVEAPAAEDGPKAPSRLLKALESPWTLGFVGLLVFSAGAFIVL